MNIVIYGDSMSWGIIPGTRNRLAPDKRWTGVLQSSLGKDYRIIEECLNGRTTMFDDLHRPARSGVEHISMILESHSPIDLVIVMLGVNDFQDVIGAAAKESANGLKALISQILSFSAEPMNKPAQVLVAIPPEIQSPLGIMTNKFSGYQRGKGSEFEYINALDDLNIHTIETSKFITLSKIDGIHLDEPEHLTLGKVIAGKIFEIGNIQQESIAIQ